MPVPTLISELSQTAASNSPPGSESPSTSDDYSRAHAAFIATLRDGKGHSAEVDVASAATTDIGAANSHFVRITGTTTITSFGTNYNGPRFIRFAAALTLTHNASSLILPGGANITTVAGDTAIVVPLAAGWQVVAYQRAAGAPVSADNLGLRNKIINGKMAIGQRGTSFAAISSAQNGTYTLDRYLWNCVTTTAAATVSQQSDVPSSNEFSSSLRVAVTTADAAVAADDGVAIMQPIEGYNVRDLIGRTFTLSFWVRSSKTGVHCIGLTNSGSDRSYVAEYTISAANTWEFKTITVTGGLPTAGTWNYTNGVGFSLRWTLMGGSTWQTTAGAWQTGQFFSTANQVNCLDTVDNIFAITAAQLEVGSAATPFEHRPYGMEFALCQRYYETGIARWDGFVGQSGVVFSVPVAFKAGKRVNPTLTQSSNAANAFTATTGSENLDGNGFFDKRTSNAVAAGAWVTTWTASAEL